MSNRCTESSKDEDGGIMKKIFEFIQEELENAFEAAGYDRGLGKVTLSNRPDLCEYQCNGAMAGAKTYRSLTESSLQVT